MGDDAREVRRRRRLGRIVGGHQAADRHPAVDLQTVEHRDHDVAADILEVQIDAVGGQTVQRLADILVLVIDGRVEAEFVGQPGALLRTARDADDATPALFGDLPRDGAHRAGGRRDDDGLAFLGLQHIGDAEIGGQTGHAEHGHIGRQRQAGRAVDRAQAAFRHDRIVGPAARGRHDDIACFEAAGSRGFDHAQRQAAHDLAQADRRQIALGIVHPGAIGRVQRQIDRADQHLVLVQIRDGRLDQFQIAGLDHALGALAQHPLTVRLAACRSHWRLSVRFLWPPSWPRRRLRSRCAPRKKRPFRIALKWHHRE